MINEIIDAVSFALQTEFGEDYDIRREDNGGEPEKPGFFVFCKDFSVKQVMKNKYLIQSRFHIRYFPVAETFRTECNSIAERMIWCLEYIDVAQELTRGTQMKCEFIDGVLNFYVNYDCYVYKMQESDAMEQIQEKQNVRN